MGVTDPVKSGSISKPRGYKGSTGSFDRKRWVGFIEGWQYRVREIGQNKKTNCK